MLSPKENYLRLGRGEMPEYVPNFTMGGMWPPSGTPTKNHPVLMAMPAVFPFGGAPGAREYKDMWGVPYISNAETNYQALPKPNEFILEDITKWRDVIKRPDVPPADTFDWEKLARDGTAHINRETTGVICMAGNGPFQALIGFMGFTEGLCALIEEPEACAELFSFMADFYMPYTEKTIEYFKPDIVYLLDDTAAQKDPFFSTEVFRRLFKPVYARYTKMAQDRGIPVQLHNCGRCEDWMQDYIDIGVKYWDPAQECNDLFAVKKKFHGQLTVVGGYNFYPDEKYNQVTEEYVRSTVRATIDRYAGGGGYAWLGGYLGRSDEMDIAAKINTWINEEVDTYGMNFYKK
ncbi:MAG: hypothetical protein LBC88_00510 [Spirochaetaceae bacterium]|jgi:hypothetical protein|nr:hypothetical protein [Spirochaetaceae bacterium]